MRSAHPIAMEYLDELPFQSRFPVFVKTLSGDLYLIEVFSEEKICDLKSLLHDEDPNLVFQSSHLFPVSNSQEEIPKEADNDDLIDPCGYHLLIDDKIYGIELNVLDIDAFEYQPERYKERFLSEAQWDEYLDCATQCLQLYGETPRDGDILVIHHDEYSPRRWWDTDIWFRLVYYGESGAWLRQIIIESEKSPLEKWEFYTETNTTRIIDMHRLIRSWSHEENTYKVHTDEELQTLYEQNHEPRMIFVDN